MMPHLLCHSLFRIRQGGDKVWRQGVETKCGDKVWRQGVSAEHPLKPSLKLTLKRHAHPLTPFSCEFA